MLTAGIMSFAGLAMLSLAMPRHWREITKQPLTSIQQRFMQLAGGAMLVVCLWLMTGQQGDPTGWVTGTAIIMLTGISWSLSFSLWPKMATLAMLTATSLAGLTLLF